MDKKESILLDKDNLSEEIFEKIYEDYFDKEKEIITGGEDNETEPK